jgi:hypothetical protein
MSLTEVGTIAVDLTFHLHHLCLWLAAGSAVAWKVLYAQSCPIEPDDLVNCGGAVAQSVICGLVILFFTSLLAPTSSK